MIGQSTKKTDKEDTLNLRYPKEELPLVSRLRALYVQAGETGLKKKDPAAAFTAYTMTGRGSARPGGDELRGANAGT